jgi:MFS family permease
MTQPQSSRQANRLRRDGMTWLIYAQFAIFGFFLYAFTPSVTLLRDDEHISDGIAGLHGTAYAVGAVTLGALGARILARIGRNRGLWLFFAALCVGIATYTSTTHLTLTLVGALIIGGSGSGLLLTTSAALVDHHGRRGPAAITEANAVSAAVGLLGPLAVGACVAWGYGWRTALLVIIPATAILFLVRKSFGPGIEVAPLDSVPAADMNVVPVNVLGESASGGSLGFQFWLSWTLVLVCVSIEFSLTLWSAQLLRDQDHLSKAAAATGVTAIVGGLALGRLVGVGLAAHRDVDWLLARAFGLNLVGFSVFWVSRNPWLAFFGLAVCGLGMALQYPLGLARAIRASAGTGSGKNVIARSNRASAQISLGTGIAIGIAPFILGFLADGIGIRYAFLLVPFLIMIAGVALVLARRSAHPSRRIRDIKAEHQPAG